MAEGLAYGSLLSLLWTPLVAVTASLEGRGNGQIAVSAHGASIVPDRPRVLVQLYKTNLTHDLVLQSGAFALNFLREDQIDLAHALGFVSGRDTDKLSDIAHSFGSTGSPLLDDCLGWVDCRVINTMDGGDMTCFLADVLEGRLISPSQPLWWREMRQQMQSAWQEEWHRKIAGEIDISRRTMDSIAPPQPIAFASIRGPQGIIDQG
ncbi:MAG: flavin reductase family protein [Dehalococcoidia bacterium]